MMNKHRAAVRIKIILTLLLLMIFDVSPIPLTASIGLYVALFRPQWFLDLVADLYNKV